MNSRLVNLIWMPPSLRSKSNAHELRDPCVNGSRKVNLNPL